MKTPQKIQNDTSGYKRAFPIEVTPESELTFSSDNDESKTKPKKRSLFYPRLDNRSAEFQIQDLFGSGTKNVEWEEVSGETKIGVIPSNDEITFHGGPADNQMSNKVQKSKRTRSLQEFLDLWEKCLMKLGPFDSTEDVERQNSFREASSKCYNGANQDTAHYGRTLFEASKKIFEFTGLKQSEIFLDIGHGMGNAPIQAAVTIGCDSRGLELVENRFSISLSFHRYICDLIDAETKISQQELLCGNVDLRQGDFCDKAHLSFMTEADVALVNNACEIFAARSQSRSRNASLDDYIAALFARMKPGSRMVTFYPLPLGLSLTDANTRRKRAGKPWNANASFFEFRTENLGSSSVSWSNKEVPVYVYTRVPNSSNSHAPEIPMFTCENEKCQTAGSVLCEKTSLLVENCLVCGRKRSATGIRTAARVNRIKYSE